MGISKKEHFNESQNRFSDLMKALAHPARIAIVEHLLKMNQCICGDIVDELPLSQPTISQHLKELKNVGIIQGNIEGNSVCYCINSNTIEELHEYFESILKKLAEKKDNCC